LDVAFEVIELGPLYLSLLTQRKQSLLIKGDIY